MTLAIIVHGGAKTIPDDKTHANTQGCLAAVRAGWDILQQGGSAKAAVEAAIRVLESDPTFNASLGATLNREGEVYLDAAMMESDGLRWGGVAAVQHISHPISVARQILEEKSMASWQQEPQQGGLRTNRQVAWATQHWSAVVCMQTTGVLALQPGMVNL